MLLCSVWFFIMKIACKAVLIFYITWRHVVWILILIFKSGVVLIGQTDYNYHTTNHDRLSVVGLRWNYFISVVKMWFLIDSFYTILLVWICEMRLSSLIIFMVKLGHRNSSSKFRKGHSCLFAIPSLASVGGKVVKVIWANNNFNLKRYHTI